MNTIHPEYVSPKRGRIHLIIVCVFFAIPNPLLNTMRPLAKDSKREKESPWGLSSLILRLLEFPRLDQLDLAHDLLDDVVGDDDRNKPHEGLQGEFQDVGHDSPLVVVSLYCVFFVRKKKVFVRTLLFEIIRSG